MIFKVQAYLIGIYYIKRAMNALQIECTINTKNVHSLPTEVHVSQIPV